MVQVRKLKSRRVYEFPRLSQWLSCRTKGGIVLSDPYSPAARSRKYLYMTVHSPSSLPPQGGFLPPRWCRNLL